ncbi:MAG: hypothetical protein A2821_02060 [Candidatus Magasanikbacteria bacterium RIFCSPHIGHO2_01_FULL_41_23]|uniref:Uncharacterized protein n=1 Tax=Candidatus Magasanikbacteria bacterium RIFCSPLOWO2_01_FULL_40_15 TaxID=1798686 RepID=A0A1F6N3Q8_9BACT|nr:MAG: hypothetical protein A2821_02060 [Candidatus Magasanikbacteria bacterium RIFCSPHIGHO2_01_FULL_41_23]OGH76431.1 MAG: hypothetical protein A3F22_00565 [Candidatus Magasanikbacteria bacterium RIFCSPHIGHO2_12_FULL_41_16]OGH78388.1 MAG: hypothetical protein A2983_02520 [Candidatus Magasanikbacteria bacterium RIFCSPLOWO2_01_FULL_40_15]
MDNQKIHLIQALGSGFCFLLADQTAKWLAFHSPKFSFYIIQPYLGWELLLNPGVGFGLPIANWLMIFVTPVILLALAFFLEKKYREPKTSVIFYYGICLTLFGALSNYIDRFLIAATIDYIRILYSVINIADISIILGVVLVIREDINRPA